MIFIFKSIIWKFDFSYDLGKLKDRRDYHTFKLVGESTDFQPYELYEELQTLIPNIPDFMKDVKLLFLHIIENN